jgi:hypothetical protein
MKYSNGKKIKVGHHIEIYNLGEGVVVSSLTDSTFLEGFPKEDWNYLKSGILVKMSDGKILHCEDYDVDIKRIE